MLAASDFSRIKRNFEGAVAMLGVTATWSRAKAPTPTKQLVLGFKTAGVKDTEIVNAYGINAVVLTVRAMDVTVAPEKFDTFTVNGVRHTADAVHPVNLNGTVIGWKVYVRGSN